MKRYIYIILFTAALISSSCTKKGQTVHPDAPTHIFLKGAVSTDHAGIFVTDINTDLTTKRYIDNEEFVRSGDHFKGAYGKQIPKKARFTAYSPYKTAILEESVQETVIGVHEDQSSLYNYIASDMTFGMADISDTSADSIKINMDKCFALLKFELTSSHIGLEDLSNSLIKVDLARKIEFDFGKAEYGEISDRGIIEPRGRFQINDGKCSGVSCIIVPQQISASDEFLHIRVNGNDATYPIGQDMKFEAGQEYTLTLNINKVGDRYLISFDITTSPWISGEDITIDTDQETDEIEPVTDIDGNEYQVIKVGPQYWMTSNLRVTRYNDGTPIKNITDNGEWDNVLQTKEGAYCYYDNDEEMKGQYGILYNWHAVETEKLCPEGWHVPTLTEFNMLIDEYNGSEFAGEDLKSDSGWKDYQNNEKPEYQGTNKSQFNGLPGGYRTITGDFSNEGKFGYWWCSSTPDSINGDAIYLYYNKPSATPITAFFRTGYSVRCIKY